jgi:hypothetical protein
MRALPKITSTPTSLSSTATRRPVRNTTSLAPVKYFGTDVTANPGRVRWGLTPGKGVFLTDINLQDITAIITGPSGAPPMLGGAKAFGGPVCPWAP